MTKILFEEPAVKDIEDVLVKARGLKASFGLTFAELSNVLDVNEKALTSVMSGRLVNKTILNKLSKWVIKHGL